MGPMRFLHGPNTYGWMNGSEHFRSRKDSVVLPVSSGKYLMTVVQAGTNRELVAAWPKLTKGLLWRKWQSISRNTWVRNASQRRTLHAQPCISLCSYRLIRVPNTTLVHHQRHLQLGMWASGVDLGANVQDGLVEGVRFNCTSRALAHWICSIYMEKSRHQNALCEDKLVEGVRYSRKRSAENASVWEFKWTSDWHSCFSGTRGPIKYFNVVADRCINRNDGQWNVIETQNGTCFGVSQTLDGWNIKSSKLTKALERLVSGCSRS